MFSVTYVAESPALRTFCRTMGDSQAFSTILLHVSFKISLNNQSRISPDKTNYSEKIIIKYSTVQFFSFAPLELFVSNLMIDVRTLLSINRELVSRKK